MSVSTSARKSRAAMVSVISNSCLVAGKLVVGLAIGSVSVISEAIHSGMDLVAAIIALWAVRSSNKPPDKDHPFGHGKFENVSGVVEALLIFVAAIFILFEAGKKIISPGEIENPSWGVLIMGISALVNWFVSRMLYRVARETDSVALEADALHLSTDVWTSVGVFAGLILVWIFGWTILDPLVAIAVALLIIREAWSMTLKAGGGLLDRELPQWEIEQIEAIISSHKPRILGFHRLRSRKAGSERHVDFHLVVDGSMTVGESHDICDVLEREIAKILPGTKTVIHVENPRSQRREASPSEMQ